MRREEFIEKWGLRELVHLCADLDAVIAAEAFRPEAGVVEQQALDELRAWAQDAAKEADAAEDALRALAVYAPRPEHREAIACAERLKLVLSRARELGLVKP